MILEYHRAGIFQFVTGNLNIPKALSWPGKCPDFSLITNAGFAMAGGSVPLAPEMCSACFALTGDVAPVKASANGLISIRVIFIWPTFVDVGR